MGDDLEGGVVVLGGDIEGWARGVVRLGCRWPYRPGCCPPGGRLSLAAPLYAGLGQSRGAGLTYL